MVNLRELPRSIKICYPVFRDHIPTREALLRHSTELFDLIRDGHLRVEIGRRYRLEEAPQAPPRHRSPIHHRKTTHRALTGTSRSCGNHRSEPRSRLPRTAALREELQKLRRLRRKRLGNTLMLSSTSAVAPFSMPRRNP